MSVDRRLRGEIDLAAVTGLPVLGQLPQIHRLEPINQSGDPESPRELAEAYRALRATLRLARSTAGGFQVIAVTSSMPGEGKSTVAARLACALAAAGNPTLLIDADMRKPTQHHQFDRPDGRGLSHVLAGAEAFQPVATSFAHLDLLICGPRPPNPAELLSGPALGDLLAQARGRYAHIVIDTPPLGAVTDALLVAERADQVVLVARDRVTDRAALARIVARLKPLGARVVGCVLNAVRLRKGDAPYEYGGKA